MRYCFILFDTMPTSRARHVYKTFHFWV